MWRAALIAAILMLGGGESVAGMISADAWSNYRQTFISEDGRVIDTANGRISHSEGQGYGMLLAVAAGDRKTFDLLWRWTKDHLAIRDDGLFAWKWVPDTTEHVPDRNNATDGDLLIAWALGRASRRFHEISYSESAAAIAKSIRNQLVRDSKYGSLLLPAASGFELKKGIVVNLSYLIFPAFRELELWDAPAFWQKLEEDNITLLDAAFKHFGGLVPDWFLLTGREMNTAPHAELRFGYDALRIPLYVCWQNDERRVDLKPLANRWMKADAPAWQSLDSDSASGEPLSNAHLSVRWLLASCLPDIGWLNSPQLPAVTLDYYGATLKLLAELARDERNE